MDIRDLVDEILELALHSDPVSADDYVQERAVHAGIWDLIEQHDKELESEWQSNSDDAEIAELEDQVSDLKDEIDELSVELSQLRKQILGAA